MSETTQIATATTTTNFRCSTCHSTLVLQTDDCRRPNGLLREGTGIVPDLGGVAHPFLSPPTYGKPKRHLHYYLDMVTFEVKDSLFMVPKYHFLQSTIFQDQGQDVMSLDPLNEQVVKLRGVSSGDFQALLKFLYPLTSDTLVKFYEWASVLRLATKWQMLSIREAAIKHISTSSPSPVARISLGREFHISEWLSSGYNDLAVREEPLSAVEFTALGLAAALKLSQQVRRQLQHTRTSMLPLANPIVVDQTPLTRAISQAFEGELVEMDKTVSLIDRVVHARSCRVSTWLSAAYVELARRPRDISVEEAEILGLETTASLCRVRERIITPMAPWSGSAHELVQVHFVAELLMAREGDRALLSPPRSRKVVMFDFALTTERRLPATPKSTSAMRRLRR